MIVVSSPGASDNLYCAIPAGVVARMCSLRGGESGFVPSSAASVAKRNGSGAPGIEKKCLGGTQECVVLEAVGPFGIELDAGLFVPARMRSFCWATKTIVAG